jgi:hypothetical protein
MFSIWSAVFAGDYEVDSIALMHLLPVFLLEL